MPCAAIPAKAWFAKLVNEVVTQKNQLSSIQLENRHITEAWQSFRDDVKRMGWHPAENRCFIANHLILQ